MSNNKVDENKGKYTLWVENKKDGQSCEYKYVSPKEKANFMYDSSSGNYHLFPEDKKTATNISYDIYNKLLNVKKTLANKLDEKNYIYKLRLQRSRDSVFDVDGFSAAKDIFSYISVIIDEDGVVRNYQLMGIRFCKHGDNIECILKSFQFAKCFRMIRSDSIYPNTLDDNAKKECKQTYCYYNPKIKFSDNNEIIAEKFMQFIEENEKEIANK